MQKLNLELMSEAIKTQLLQLKEISYSGGLKIKTDNSLHWTLNFRMGRLSWVTGGSNPDERLKRHLALFCPENMSAELKQLTSEQEKYNECKLLIQLQGRRIIERAQLTNMMISLAAEVLFDIIQYSKIHGESLSYEILANDPDTKLGLLLPFTETEIVLKKATEAWEKWQNAELAAYSPNLFPLIEQPETLQKQVTDKKQQKLLSSIDGSKTLRGLAAKSQQDIVSLTQFIIPLVKIGAISFSAVPSPKPSKLQVIDQKIPNDTSSLTASSIKSPLVACVDDSPLICQALEKIITKQGYRFISIQQPLKVIPTLLKNKPDFIFLDLLMPIVNGYELCAQLRRTPRLQSIPIVILTGKDGLVDRMRAKLVGSTDFISKPVDAESVLNILDKFLTVNHEL
jgi:chemotaxis family two-component system response regulator PixG